MLSPPTRTRTVRATAAARSAGKVDRARTAARRQFIKARVGGVGSGLRPLRTRSHVMPSLLPRLLSVLDHLHAPAIAHAHCDLPCGVYDPAQARIEAESVKAIMEKFNEST